MVLGTYNYHLFSEYESALIEKLRRAGSGIIQKILDMEKHLFDMQILNMNVPNSMTLLYIEESLLQLAACTEICRGVIYMLPIRLPNKVQGRWQYIIRFVLNLY